MNFNRKQKPKIFHNHEISNNFFARAVKTALRFTDLIKVFASSLSRIQMQVSQFVVYASFIAVWGVMMSTAHAIPLSPGCPTMMHPIKTDMQLATPYKVTETPPGRNELKAWCKSLSADIRSEATIAGDCWMQAREIERRYYYLANIRVIPIYVDYLDCLTDSNSVLLNHLCQYVVCQA